MGELTEVGRNCACQQLFLDPSVPAERRVVLTDSRAASQPRPDLYSDKESQTSLSELRAAGFAPSVLTLAVATSSDLPIWTYSDLHLDD
jgi:hypothetical protein